METSPSDSPSPRSSTVFILEAYRLALLLTGSPANAAAHVREAYASLNANAASSLPAAERHAWVLRRLREAVPSSDGISPWDQLASLSKPARLAFAFFQCVRGTPHDLAKFLDLPSGAKGVADALSQARQSLAPEQYFPVEPLLQLHRPWGGDPADVAAAVAGVEEGIAPQLASQAAFDTQWHEAVEAIAFPEGEAGEGLEKLRNEADEEEAPSGLRAILRQPAVLAIAVALLVMMGVGILAAMKKMHEFPGKELIASLLEEEEDGNEIKLEEIEATEAGRLGDWFLLKGFENFSVPAEFDHSKAVACRVFKHAGYTVAQLALEPRNAALFVFRPSESDLRLESPNWQIYQQDDWAVAVRKDGETCYIVSFLGDAEDMPQFLNSGGEVRRMEGKTLSFSERAWFQPGAPSESPEKS